MAVDLMHETIESLQTKLESGEATSLELTQQYLDAIDENKLNAFLYIARDEALAEAEAADKRRKSGETGPLLGIPYAVKDNMVAEGMPATAASKILEGYVGTYDATVIKKLREAGAVLLGKTNMDEFAMGSSTENSAFGRVKHPSNPDLVPGGSSGGSAVAVAAGLCAFALGSDTGGSIRQPAAFTGVVGMKPTYGAVSRYGLIAMASSLDQIGPFTRSVKDAEIVLAVITGADPLDSTTASVTLSETKGLDSSAKPRSDKGPSQDGVRGMKLGVPRGLFKDGIAQQVQTAFAADCAKLKQQGADIVEIDLPHIDAALAVYYVIMPVEVASNLSRYDGIRYGYSVEREAGDQKLTPFEVYAQSRAKGFGAEAKRRIMLGTYASSAGYYDAYYGTAQKVRTLVIQDFETAFKKVDAVLMPTTPTPPFKAGEKTTSPLEMYLADIFTVPANIAGIPGISVPSHSNDAEAPLGLQILAPHFKENVMFNVAKAYEGAK